MVGLPADQLRIGIFFLTILSPLAGLLADTLTLKDGTVLEGKILSQSQVQIQIQTKEGIKTIPKPAVRRIVFGPSDVEKKPEKTPEQEEEERQKAEALRKEQEAAERARKEREAELERQRQIQIAEERSRGALWRSAVLPGWGQYYKGEERRGAYFFAGNLAALFVLYDGRTKFQANLAKARTAETIGFIGLTMRGSATPANLIARSMFQEARTGMETGGRQAFVGLLAFVGLYVYNLMDASATSIPEPAGPPVKPTAWGASLLFADAGPGIGPDRGITFEYTLRIDL